MAGDHAGEHGAHGGEPETPTGVAQAPPPAGGALPAEDLPDGVLVADERGRVVVVNRLARRLCGVTAASALGRDFRDILPLLDADGRDWWKRSDPYGGLRIRTRQPERLLYHADGREILVAARYVRDEPRGALTRLVVLLRDASRRGPRERGSGSAILVSTVAHELRSPLTSVKGFTATLLNKWDRLTDSQKHFMLETVNADADRVTRLISDLLGVSRIESGRLELRRRYVDLPEQARRVIAGRIAAGETQDRFRLETQGRLPQMWLDADKVEQIMSNLVENAVRHGAGTVTVVIEPHEGGAAVSVRDEGAGIAPDSAARVFHQFWRNQHRGGTGLGLFIVKGLVEAHGGAITIDRAPSGGAEFRFTVPAGPSQLA